jgi:hypothetical protein
MLPVKVTVQVGSRRVSTDQVSDMRVVRQLESAGREVGTKLAKVSCPEHKRGPTNVRIHFDRNGTADLAYDSCCDALGALVSRALG